MIRSRHAVPAAVLGALVSVAVATGCGVQSNNTGPTTRTAAGTATSGTSTTTAPTATTIKLPTRPNGTIAVDLLAGDATGSSVVQSFSTTSDTNVRLTTGSDVVGFADLCAGKVDVTTATRAPTTAELAQCKKNGIALADPIQTASDAIVLATKNGADVGGDCVTVRQARDIFRAGSQYTNWNQLGFDDLPVRTTGREQGSAGFDLFGQIVLGLATPTIADVRSDYVVRTSDKGERETVTGAVVQRIAAQRIAAHKKFLERSTKQARTNYVNQAVAAANKKALAVIDKVNAQNKKKKLVVNGPKLIASNAKFVARVKSEATARATAKFDKVIAARQAAFAKSAVKNTGQRGFVGPFRYSYYGLYEQQLRPLEIDYGVPETKSEQPIQLQDLTTADQLAVQAQITGVANKVIGPTTTTTTATTASGTLITKTVRATPKVTLPPDTIVPPLDNLPTKTKDGQTIYPGPNCVFPSVLTITSGAYPLSRRVFAYTTKTALKRPEVRDFLTYFVGKAQTLAGSEQLIPITDLQKAADLAIIQGKPAPATPKQNGGEATLTATTATTSTTLSGTSTAGSAGPAGAAGTSGGTSTSPATTTPTGTTPTLAKPNPGDNSGVPGVSNRDVSKQP